MFRSMRDGVKMLLILNGGIFALQWILRLELSRQYGLVPLMVLDGHLYQLITYMYLHGNFMHVLLNMMGLFFFAPALEEQWGTGKFLVFYHGTGIAGGLLSVILNPSSFIPTIGASGAVYGVLAASAAMFPNAVIYLYLVIPVRAKWLILGLGLYEFWSLFSGSRSGISHEAHLGGLLTGGLYVLITEKFLGYRVSRKIKQWQYEQKWERDEKLRQQKQEEMQRLRDEADELLDKVNQRGLDSLTVYERKRLDEIARKLRGE